jgi:DNA-binding transcriptional ArsR family regulator
MDRAGASGGDLDLVFAALADGTRRAILARLVDADQSVSALAEPFAMSLAAVSKHVHVLARAGLVSQVTTGRERRCRLEPDGLRAAGAWLRGFGHFDLEDWDALEALLAALDPDALHPVEPASEPRFR